MHSKSKECGTPGSTECPNINSNFHESKQVFLTIAASPGRAVLTSFKYAASQERDLYSRSAESPERCLQSTGAANPERVLHWKSAASSEWGLYSRGALTCWKRSAFILSFYFFIRILAAGLTLILIIPHIRSILCNSGFSWKCKS